MPTVPIQIGKGTFANVGAFELGNAEYAAELLNIHIDDSNCNVDRPAFSSFATIGSFPVIGLAFFNSKLVAVTSNDRKIWQIDSAGAVTDITGTALAGSARPVFADDGGFLAIAGGAAPRTWDGSGDTAIMAGSPPNCSHMSYLDGYWITHLLADQEFRLAGPTAGTRLTWSSADFFQAEGLPDNVTSQAVLIRELYAFGSNSIEIFQNFGDSDAPFQRTFFIDDSGTEAPYSVVKADNTLFYFDSVRRRFIQIQSRTPVDIGTPYDRTVKGFTTVTDCWGTKIDIEGLYLIVWTFPTEERTFVYDYKKKEWCEWNGFRSAMSNRLRIHSHCYAPAWNKHFVGDPLTGTVWQLSREFKTDGDDVLRRLRRTGIIDHGTGHRKRNNVYEFDVKRGLGASGEAEPVMQVRFKDDDKDWSEPRYLGLGSTGERSGVVRLYRTGIYRKRQIEISMTDNAEFLLKSINEDVDDLGK